MKSKIVSFVLLCVFANTANLFSQTIENLREEEALSLSEALRIAYTQNPEMIQVRREIDAAKGRRIQAEALPDPEVEFEIGGLKKEDGHRKGNLDSFDIKQPLDPFGTRFLRASIAKDNIKIAKGDLNVVWARVREQALELYATILAEQKALEVARDNLSATRQFFTQVETRYQSGNALQSDVIRARIEVSRSENDLLISQKNLQVAKGQLNLVLGRPVETGFELTDTLTYEALQYEYQVIKQEAFARRADLLNEKIRIKAREKGFGSALLKTFLPKSSIGVERFTESFENDTAILVSFSYPLWGFNLGEVKEAKAEKEKQKVRYEALEREVGLEVYQGFLEAELADKQVQIQKKANDEANELLRQITLRYEEGSVAFLTYLENIKTIKETRLAYFNALKTYKEKVAELERVIQATPIPEGVSS